MDEQDYYRQALKHAAMLVEALKGMIATTAGHDDDWVGEHLGTDKSSFIKQMTRYRHAHRYNRTHGIVGHAT
jgi:hypothetical protein